MGAWKVWPEIYRMFGRSTCERRKKSLPTLQSTSRADVLRTHTLLLGLGCHQRRSPGCICRSMAPSYFEPRRAARERQSWGVGCQTQTAVAGCKPHPALLGSILAASQPGCCLRRQRRRPCGFVCAGLRWRGLPRRRHPTVCGGAGMLPRVLVPALGITAMVRTANGRGNIRVQPRVCRAVCAVLGVPVRLGDRAAVAGLAHHGGVRDRQMVRWGPQLASVPRWWLGNVVSLLDAASAQPSLAHGAFRAAVVPRLRDRDDVCRGDRRAASVCRTKPSATLAELYSNRRIQCSHWWVGWASALSAPTSLNGAITDIDDQHSHDFERRPHMQAPLETMATCISLPSQRP